MDHADSVAYLKQFPAPRHPVPDTLLNRAASKVDHSHLVDLADGWTSWRTLCLRSTGFPVNMLEKLAAPAAVSAIDLYLEREAAYKEARHLALAARDRLLKESDRDARKSLKRAGRQILQNLAADPLPDFPEMNLPLEALGRAQDELTVARGEAERCIEAALSGISDALRDVGRDARFREAVLWQNRQAVHQGIDVLLRTPAGTRNAQARKYEKLVIRYLQRYCAKNETIGFFGPVGWGDWSDDGPPLTQRPGPSLVAGRKVHFEYWAINALAEALSRSHDLRKWLCPRLNPKIRIEDNALVLPREVLRPVPPEVLRILAACDGETAAVDIAAGLIADPDFALRSEDQVYRVLDQAAARRVVSWALDVAVGPRPERSLRKILESVGEPVLRSQVLRALDQLESVRDAVAAAAGEFEALDAALGELELVFTQHTGQEPYQRPGEVYAGRAVVYEDCLRQTEVEIGPDIRRQIGPPLALVLQSARWFCHTIAARFGDHLNQLYARLEARFAPQPVPVSALEFLFDPRTPVAGIVRKTAEELTARWASILPFEADARELHLSADDLREKVSSAFDAPGPGWPGARHHSADILIASEGSERAQSRRLLCVLGEVHVADTMVTRPALLQLHPRPDDLAEAYRRDADRARIFRITPRDYRGHRKLWDPFLPSDFQLAWDNSPPWRTNTQLLRVADLIIENSMVGLVVRTRDGALRLPAVVYFERLLWRESLTNFKLLPPARHTPRITVDKLVIHRETWRFLCRDLAFIYEKTEIDRLIGARRWARSHGLPHWVFARFPQEYKPIYVDLESPASVEIMAALARRAVEVGGDSAELGLSEMLPNPAQSWLTDVKGDAYTSELRIVLVDPKSWQPPDLLPAG